MKYDTTGPVTISETKSLLALLALLAAAASGIWVYDHFRKHEPPPNKPAVSTAQPNPGRRSERRRLRTTRPADTSPAANAVVRNTGDSSFVLVKAQGTYIGINFMWVNKTRNLRIARTYPRGATEDEAQAQCWETARAVARMIREPAFADSYYNATQDQLNKLNALRIRFPRLTPAQQKTITDLFLATEGKKDAELAKADKALIDAVAQMPVSPEELDELEDTAAAARAILRPDQLDLIDGSIDRRGGRSR